MQRERLNGTDTGASAQADSKVAAALSKLTTKSPPEEIRAAQLAYLRQYRGQLLSLASSLSLSLARSLSVFLYLPLSSSLFLSLSSSPNLPRVLALTPICTQTGRHAGKHSFIHTHTPTQTPRTLTHSHTHTHPKACTCTPTQTPHTLIVSPLAGSAHASSLCFFVLYLHVLCFLMATTLVV